MGKTKRYENEYPIEFYCNPRNELFCQLYETTVKCDKRFPVEQHRQTAKHQRKMSSASGQGTPKTQSSLSASHKDFMLHVDVAKHSWKLDIPLHKLQHTSNKFWDNIALLNRFAEAILKISNARVATCKENVG